MNDVHQPDQRDDDFEAELRFHFDETVEALEAGGLPPGAARAEATRRFGTLRHRHDLARIDRAIHWRSHMRQLFTFDLRAAARSLRHSPLLAAVAIISVALGVGANTALFSVVNSLLLRPLPVHEPERLVLLGTDDWTNPIWEQIRDRQAQSFDGALAWGGQNFNLAPTGEAQIVSGAYVSGGFFSTLGVSMAAGRDLTRDDDRRGGGPDGAVAVIGYGLWQRRFGGSPTAVGERLKIDQRDVTIVGIAPRGFNGPEVGRAVELYLPFSTLSLGGTSSALDARSNWWINVMLRLRPGQSPQAAAAVLNAWRPAIRAATLPNFSGEALKQYLSEDFTLVDAARGRSDLRTRYATPLTIIMVVVGGVLLIACANLANLMLARATARRHEMSVRLALGASRGRLVRQLLAEGLLLAVAGCVAGLVLARVLGTLLVSHLGTDVSVVSLDLPLDGRVLMFTSGLALLTTLFFGLVPAAGLDHLAPNDALKEHTRSVAGDRRVGIRHLLVVAQFALSLLLLVGALLFGRTFRALTTTPLGFEPDGLIVASINTAPTGLAAPDRLAFFDRVLTSVAATPGITAASASSLTPLSGSGWNARVKLAPDSTVPARDRMSFRNAVGPGWFGMYGMRLLAGRDIIESDVAGSEPVAVVNETFARRFLSPASAIGERVEFGSPSGQVERFTVVGVVNDAVYRSARAGVVPVLYMPWAQDRPGANLTVTARLTGDRAAAREAFKRALDGIDNRMTFTFRDYEAQVAATVAQERLVAALSMGFGGLALLLSALGLYGVTAYAVNRRRAEIAIRMALGADPGRVVRLVLRQVAMLVLAGAVIGLGLAWWAGTFVSQLLFKLDARDPMTLVVAVTTLAAIGLLAGWLPARRAARLDPTTVLRQ